MSNSHNFARSFVEHSMQPWSWLRMLDYQTSLLFAQEVPPWAWLHFSNCQTTRSTTAMTSCVEPSNLTFLCTGATALTNPLHMHRSHDHYCIRKSVRPHSLWYKITAITVHVPQWSRSLWAQALTHARGELEELWCFWISPLFSIELSWSHLQSQAETPCTFLQSLIDISTYLHLPPDTF